MQTRGGRITAPCSMTLYRVFPPVIVTETAYAMNHFTATMRVTIT